MWYAKPSSQGGYAMSSTEGTANINAIYNYVNTEYGGCTVDAISAFIALIYDQSNLNPWSYGRNTILNNYGFFMYQFDAYRSAMLAFPEYAPNTSRNSISSGALPSDAECQLICAFNLGVRWWYDTLWKPNWSKRTYQNAWEYSRDIMSRYGVDNKIYPVGVLNMDNVYDAVFTVVTCGMFGYMPTDVDRLYELAMVAYDILGGSPTPPVPPPTPVSTKKTPFWVYTCRPY